MPEELKDTIKTAAASPAEVEGDSGRVKQQPIADMIAADRYYKSCEAATKKHRGLRFAKMVSPGAD